ncbi:ras-related protein Rab-3C isoform X2 [Myotis daubentonii]|uniref:ras-related protein Rab-3C isoform X2 n=1 Tax=Myotis daubentonii TaxID=98922 RepID=UPI002873692E|nr:ras-related protein Rab-3C isoform X2 [Myotis daubentonii]
MDLYGKMAAAQDARSGQKDSSDQNFDYMFKLLIIGNSSVGKTSFLFRYADDSFTSAFVSTVGIDFKVKTVFKNEKRIKLQIWDTAGQERYRTITTAYYRGAMGFILMYDITNGESFNAVQDWSTQIKTYSWDNAQVILVGNKCDMEDERVVSVERGRRLGEQLAKDITTPRAVRTHSLRRRRAVSRRRGHRHLLQGLHSFLGRAIAREDLPVVSNGSGRPLGCAPGSPGIAGNVYSALKPTEEVGG